MKLLRRRRLDVFCKLSKFVEATLLLRKLESEQISLSWGDIASTYFPMVDRATSLQRRNLKINSQIIVVRTLLIYVGSKWKNTSPDVNWDISNFVKYLFFKIAEKMVKTGYQIGIKNNTIRIFLIALCSFKILQNAILFNCIQLFFNRILLLAW